MILYGISGGCSQASHIALVAAGVPHKFVHVGRDRRTEDGRDFASINAKGYTPALELDDGSVLTESLAILAYVADHSGRLLAPSGMERWRALEATEFMTTELHSNFRPLFRGGSPQEKERAEASLLNRFATIDQLLGDREFLIGPGMTIADTYLFVMLNWASMFNIEVSKRLEDFRQRMLDLPAVAQALSIEKRP